jgi:hypothetical protein
MMRDWLPYQREFQEEILSSESPGSDTSCASCEKLDGGQYRCSDCYFNGLLCQECCVKDHTRHPFHSISQWNGKYFQSTSLQAIGFVLYLGHGGLRCPANDWLEDENGGGEFTVVDMDGVYNHKMVWCGCTNAPQRWKQLLQMKLYPASVQFPRTAFTFQLLRYYNIDILECSATASSFMSKLRRLTNLYHPLTVPVIVIFVCEDSGQFIHH